MMRRNVEIMLAPYLHVQPKKSSFVSHSMQRKSPRMSNEFGGIWHSLSRKMMLARPEQSREELLLQ